MATAQDRLKWAFNILAKGGIDNVDLYAELGKTEALAAGIGMMQQPVAEMPQMPILPTEQAVDPMAQPPDQEAVL